MSEKRGDGREAVRTESGAATMMNCESPAFADGLVMPSCGSSACGCAGSAAGAGHPVDRRQFLSAAAIASATALLAACSNVLGPDSGRMAWGGPLTVKLSDYSTLAQVGGVARVDAGHGAPTALVRTATSTFIGLSMVCPHQGATIGIASSGFFCPNHGAQFSSSGTWRSGQAAGNLHGLTATYDAVAGTVTVDRPA